MQKSLFLKALVIGSLFIMFMIPLGMIRGVIGERAAYRDTVIRDIAQSSAGEQKISGPLIVLPYKEHRVVEVNTRRDEEPRTKTVTVQKYKYIVPDTLEISGDVKTEERYRGIYKVPVYKTALEMKGRFTLPPRFGLDGNPARITPGEPFIALGVSDMRGIQGDTVLTLDGAGAELQPGTQTRLLPQGIHAALPGKPETAAFTDGGAMTYAVSLNLAGMRTLSFLPIGKETVAGLRSPWPHPSFLGRYLPEKRAVGDDGFTAQWRVSQFASNVAEQVEACGLSQGACSALHANGFGVSLIEGVDIYQQAERSVKYGILFVGLTFVAFALFEIMKRMQIHAVQYALVGVALAFFYLLLVSLSEHIAFGAAYLVSAVACVGLLTFYVSCVLRSARRGLGFGAALSGLYFALFMILRSEDFALLMGSILLFGALAVVMTLTRNVDWYSVGGQARAGKPRARV